MRDKFFMPICFWRICLNLCILQNMSFWKDCVCICVCVCIMITEMSTACDKEHGLCCQAAWVRISATLFASRVTVVISKFTLLYPSFLPCKVEKITVAIFRYCCKDEIIKHMQSTLENYVWIG